MATDNTVQTSEDVKNYLYLFPAFTCDRWTGSLYDSEHNKKIATMTIRQDELLTFEQRVELETRSLVLQYQIEYAKKEYELLRKEFQKIEEKLKGESSDAEHDFAKPEIPSKEAKKPKKTKSDSGASGDEATVKSKKGRKGGKAGSDTEMKGTSTEVRSTRSTRSVKKSGSSTSESDPDRGLTSSTESTSGKRI